MGKVWKGWRPGDSHVLWAYGKAELGMCLVSNIPGAHRQYRNIAKQAAAASDCHYLANYLVGQGILFAASEVTCSPTRCTKLPAQLRQQELSQGSLAPTTSSMTTKSLALFPNVLLLSSSYF